MIYAGRCQAKASRGSGAGGSALANFYIAGVAAPRFLHRRREGLPWPWDRAMIYLSLPSARTDCCNNVRRWALATDGADSRASKYWWSLQPGWSWMNGYNQKRQLQRSSGLASFYVLPFVNDKAAQLQQLAIHSYVSCLNVATIMKNLCLNINALFSVFFCENTMIILSTINKLCTR